MIQNARQIFLRVSTERVKRGREREEQVSLHVNALLSYQFPAERFIHHTSREQSHILIRLNPIFDERTIACNTRFTISFRV